MNSNKQIAEKSIFVLFFLFSMFSMHSDRLGSYWGNNGTPYLFLRFFLVIILTSFATFFNRNNIDFITKFEPPATLCITVLLIFDYFVTQFSGSQFLYNVWWMSYIIVTTMTVFAVVTLVCKDNYAEFYRKFWLSFTPLYVFVFIICFLRPPGDKYYLNLILGQGTFLMLKALINDIHVSFEAPLMFFGNIAIFTPLPFILSAI